MIESIYDLPTLALTLSIIRREVTTLRAEVSALDLPPSESACYLAALALIDRRAARLSAEALAIRAEQ